MEKDLVALLGKIREIEAIIQQKDRDVVYSNKYTLNSMQEHVEEIKNLFTGNNAHWKDETIDLLIHCLLFLNRSGCDMQEIESILDRRIKRFSEKITAS